MEIKITSRHVWNVLLILSWLIFVGLSIEAGGLIVNAVFTIVNPAVITQLWRQFDLSVLYKYDEGDFFVITLILSIVAVLKAWLFFLIIRIMHSKDLNISRPFNKTVRRFIFQLSYAAFLIGIFSAYGFKYTVWLIAEKIEMPDLQLGGYDVWLFMAAVLFITAQIFKRGIEIQSENELTV